MKVLFLLFLGCFSVITTQSIAQSNIDLNDLLNRLSQNHMGSVSDSFSPEELTVLEAHFNTINDPSSIESVLLERRGIGTQTVVPVRVIQVDPTDLSSLIDFGPLPLSEFEGAGFTFSMENNCYVIDNSNRVYVRGLDNNSYNDTGVNLNVTPGQSVTGVEVLSNNEVYAIATN